MTVRDETKEMTAIISVYISHNVFLSLINEAKEDVTMMFVYSPAGLGDHWAEESVRAF